MKDERKSSQNDKMKGVYDLHVKKKKLWQLTLNVHCDLINGISVEQTREEDLLFVDLISLFSNIRAGNVYL